MKSKGLQIDRCSHSGLVSEGLEIYNEMESKYGITPTIIHKTCMVDLLGRAGRLDEAELFIDENNTDIIILMSLLGACRKYNHLERAERVFAKIMQLDSSIAAAYVLLSNVYSFHKLYDKADQIRALMEERQVFKIPGQSFIEIDNKVHSFVCGEKSHPMIQDILLELDRLGEEIVKAGYCPDTNWVTKDLSQAEKVEVLGRHSERIVMAFAFISLPKGSPIHITNNLRVCGDCHVVTKFIVKYLLETHEDITTSRMESVPVEIIGK